MHEKKFCYFPKRQSLSHNYLPKSSKLILELNIQDAIRALLLHEASFTTLIIECQTVKELSRNTPLLYRWGNEAQRP